MLWLWTETLYKQSYQRIDQKGNLEIAVTSKLGA
jgi:hypothetical protein